MEKNVSSPVVPTFECHCLYPVAATIAKTVFIPRHRILIFYPRNRAGDLQELERSCVAGLSLLGGESARRTKAISEQPDGVAGVHNPHSRRAFYYPSEILSLRKTEPNA